MFEDDDNSGRKSPVRKRWPSERIIKSFSLFLKAVIKLRSSRQEQGEAG